MLLCTDVVCGYALIWKLLLSCSWTRIFVDARHRYHADANAAVGDEYLFIWCPQWKEEEGVLMLGSYPNADKGWNSKNVQDVMCGWNPEISASVEKWRVISWDRPLYAAKNSVRIWSRCKRQQWTVPVRSSSVHYYFDLGPNFFDNERDIVALAAIYCTCNLKVTRGAWGHLVLGRKEVILALTVWCKWIRDHA